MLYYHHYHALSTSIIATTISGRSSKTILNSVELYYLVACSYMYLYDNVFKIVVALYITLKSKTNIDYNDIDASAKYELIGCIKILFRYDRMNDRKKALLKYGILLI